MKSKRDTKLFSNQLTHHHSYHNQIVYVKLYTLLLTIQFPFQYKSKMVDHKLSSLFPLNYYNVIFLSIFFFFHLKKRQRTKKTKALYEMKQFVLHQNDQVKNIQFHFSFTQVFKDKKCNTLPSNKEENVHRFA